MKVFFINSVCGYGSTGHIVVDLYNGLVESGNEACIAYGRGQAPDGIDTYRIGSNLDVMLHGALSRITDRQGFYSKKATKRLINKIKEYNPDIIHLHNIHGYYLNVPLLFEFLNKYNKPIVWTLHDCWSFTGHCSHYEASGCDKWKRQCQKCEEKSEYPKSFLLDNSKKNYLEKKNLFTQNNNIHFITPSNWLKKQVEESFFSDCEIKVIPTGIDLQVFKPHMCESKGKKIVLGVSSVWNKKKGLEDFIKLAKTIDNEIYQVVLIGLNNKQISQLPNNIIGIERTENVEELASFYSEAEVFVNPTYEDNFPTTNIEALACGTPVVTYRTGGSGESIEGIRGCLIVDKGDILSIKNHIIKSNKTKMIQEECRKSIEIYNKKLFIKKNIDVYEAFMNL